MSTKPNKLQAAIFKLAGTVVLLFALAIQHFQYAEWKDSADVGKEVQKGGFAVTSDLRRAEVAASGIVTDDLRKSIRDYLWNIKTLCIYVDCKSFVPSQLSLELPDIYQLAETIKTQDDYKTLSLRYFEIHKKALDLVSAKYIESLSMQHRSRYLYGLLYLVGSLLLVIGLAYEIRAVRE